MKIALIYPNNNRSDYKPNTIYEPTSLLGLYNILKQGADTYLYDAQMNNYSVNEMVSELKKIKPDWLLISVFETNEIINFISQVIDSLREINPKIRIMVGGPGVTYNCDKICNVLKPDVAIMGEGEQIITELMQCAFDITKLDDKYNPSIIGNTLVVSGIPLKDIDIIAYERDYDLSAYNYQAMPNIQRGCIGKCIYCTGCGFQPVRYKSPEQVFNEINYLLRDKKVNKIMPFGPDFTVKPKSAAQIIEYLVKKQIKNTEFIFVVRLDTLYKSLIFNPEVWNTFMQTNKVIFQIGVETFNPSKLIRLGKYPNINNKFAHQQYEMLEHLLGSYPAIFQCFFILLDPESTKVEIKNDIDKMQLLLKRYPTRFQITGKLLNYLEIYSKTQSQIIYDCDWYENSATLIKKIYKIMEMMNTTKLYSKSKLITDADYQERANDQIKVLNNFLKEVGWL